MAFSDDFNRADGALGANWADISGLSIVSNNAGLTDGAGGARVAPATESFSADQEAQAILSGSGGGTPFDRIGVGVRMNAALDGYFALFVPGGTEYELWKIVGGTFTQIAGPVARTPVTGSVLKIKATGTTIKAFFDGVEDMSVVDAEIASGQPGMRSFGSFSGVRRSLDDFTAQGALQITPVGIASAEAFGVHLVGLQSVQPVGIPSAEAFGVPFVGIPPVEPVGIPSAETFGTPFVGGLSIQPVGIASAEAFGVHSAFPVQLGNAVGEAFINVLVDPEAPLGLAEMLLAGVDSQDSVAPTGRVQPVTTGGKVTHRTP